ncbi:MAG TPA: TlpA disulfide reductase family protein [Terriglobales bacterium]|nr:TlpA disulfide reductase family protein [Terriglobales bacterium]
MNKLVLSAAILVTGTGLAGLHYKLKPEPSERDIRATAQGIGALVRWQGQIAPNFEFTTTRGEHFRLSEHIGKKVIVLNFFATWCGPCREEMPELNRYFNVHKSESFLILGIDAEENADKVNAFFDELKVDFPAGVDSGPIRKLYAVDVYPTTVLIGVDGKVQFYETGELVNAEVAFDKLLQTNRDLLSSGKAVSLSLYLAEAQKQGELRSREPQSLSQKEEQFKLDARGNRIVAKMFCPCGCDDKVQACTCHTSKNVKKALASEDFKGKPDDEIVRELNKRFCSGAM